MCRRLGLFQRIAATITPKTRPASAAPVLKAAMLASARSDRVNPLHPDATAPTPLDRLRCDATIPLTPNTPATYARDKLDQHTRAVAAATLEAIATGTSADGNVIATDTSPMAVRSRPRIMNATSTTPAIVMHAKQASSTCHPTARALAHPIPIAADTNTPSQRFACGERSRCWRLPRCPRSSTNGSCAKNNNSAATAMPSAAKRGVPSPSPTTNGTTACPKAPCSLGTTGEAGPREG